MPVAKKKKKTSKQSASGARKTAKKAAARTSPATAAKKTGKQVSKKTAKKTARKVAKKTAKQAGKPTAKKPEQKAAAAPAKKKTAKAADKSSGKGIDLLIIDSHAMAYRAYYGLQGQNLTHPVTGMPTNAVFGFFRMFFKVLQDLQPAHTAVVWDPPGGSFRREVYPEYKANRKPTPDDLRPQIDEIKELVSRAGFPTLMVMNYEADDVMGSLARRFGKKNRVVILSGDKDCYQLLNKNVTMLRGSKGVTEFLEIDPQWVETELGVTVDQITDYMGLIGDSSDNIPGARGIGPKGASKLLQEYKNLKGVYKNLAKVEPKGVRAKLEESKDNVFLSQDLATIRTEMPEVEKIDPNTLLTPDYLKAEVLQMFRDEGYNAIFAELNRALERRKAAEAQADAPDTKSTKSAKSTKATKADGKAGGKKGAGDEGDAAQSADDDAKSAGPVAKSGGKYELIDSIPALQDALAQLTKLMGKKKVLTVDTETDHQEPMRARLVGISMCAKPGKAVYVALPPAEDSLFASEGLDADEARPLLKAFLEDPDLKIIGQNIKYDMIVLRNWGLDLPAPYFDTMIASYLCNPNVRRHNMDDMAVDLLGYETIKYAEIVGSGRNKKTMAEIPPAEITDYACEDADITYQLHDKLVPALKLHKLEAVQKDIEVALVPVLTDMEMEGVAIDVKYFQSLSTEYAKKLKKLEKQIHKAAGYEFNINSTKELQKVLFEDLKLPTGKKTKTGYSTDQSVLEDLRGKHTVVDQLLEHRKYGKLKSTYVDALPALVNPKTKRIHTSFNQTIAATGRLSSMDPNLQNIPIREETGRMIRRGFIPRKGNVLLSLDYSQIELRIMAHYAEDKALIDTFQKKDVDIHTRTAASLFAVAEDAVDPDMRSKGKAVNFSIIYGVTEFGLSRNLGISREEARLYIERFFEKYPGVRRYMDETIAFAGKKGYVQTLTGRMRQIPEIKTQNRFRREGAERTAINTPIQGTSADIIKLAMLDIHRDLQAKELKSKMILQVHDELLFDVAPAEKDTVLKIARERMEGAMQLKVPLDVDYSFGKNWDEAH
ncbi:MAG: DNA polymerase I [bacterium]|nr:DNA polymerase I [bacterium]